MRGALLAAFVAVAGCGTSSTATPAPDGGLEGGDVDAAAGAVDWALVFDPSATAGPLPPTLLGHYDLSGALFHYDQQRDLASLMKGAGFAEWRVGVGRWEVGTLLLPTLSDNTSCGT